MDDGVRIIEKADEARHRKNLPPLFLCDGIPISDDDDVPVSPTREFDEKTWVVFVGKTTGVYSLLELASIQTIGQRDGFQRCYPDRASAEAAYDLFQSDGTYPEYGKAPWVVFLGRRIGVMQKVTELETSIKGFINPIFCSCGSVSEGRIKFELFSQKVTHIFKESNGFAAIEVLTPHRGENMATNPPVSTPAPTPQPIAGPSNSRSPRSVIRTTDPGSTSASSSRRIEKAARPVPNQGWFVAWIAVIPGVYYGGEALKAAQPKRRGYTCAADEDSAHDIFHECMINDRIIFIPKRE